MSNKFKFFIFFVSLFILFIFGAISVENKNAGPFIQSIKSILPTNIKVALKKTIFSIPTLNRRIEQHETTINELSMKVEELNKKVELIDGPELLASASRNIKSKLNIYNIRSFHIPFLVKHSPQRLKAVAYLEQTNDEIMMASGSGEFFSFAKKNIGSDNLYLKRIQSNIKNLIRNEKFYSSSFIGIRDLLILDNKIFFSFIKEQTSECYNISVAISEFNLNYLNFSEFFSYEECVSNKNMQKYPYELAHLSLAHSGGKMVPFKNRKILLTIGDMGHKLLPQDKNSMFGKIISIDLKSKDYEIIAMGSRNAQGLWYDEDRNIIIHTEHGPIGGDEININFNPDNKKIENYGWPIASYGEEGKFIKEAPLHKSHKDYGFIEPIKYYTPSIAISEIVKIPKTFNEKFTNDFFISTLGRKNQMNEGDRSIHHIRLNENYDQIIFEDIMPIGERIRDMIFIKEENIVLMLLESIPAIGVLKLVS